MLQGKARPARCSSTLTALTAVWCMHRPAERVVAAVCFAALTLLSNWIEPWGTLQRRGEHAMMATVGGDRRLPESKAARATLPLLLACCHHLAGQRIYCSCFLPCSCAVSAYAVRAAESDGIAQGVLAVPSVLAALVVADPEGAASVAGDE